MQCFRCASAARATCCFCGNAVCGDHRQNSRMVYGWMATGSGGWGRVPRTQYDLITVPDAAWCGACHPEAATKE
ncbi:MAG: hypothetical protein V4510_02090 [bacterium]